MDFVLDNTNKKVTMDGLRFMSYMPDNFFPACILGFIYG